MTRYFDTGATRDSEEGKLDYEGFLSPLVVKRYAEYMHKHRLQPDGKLRAADNWQKGIPREAYMKSMWRHFMDIWLEHRGQPSREGLHDALCAVIFNAMGYLHEELKDQEEFYHPALTREERNRILKEIEEIENENSNRRGPQVARRRSRQNTRA